LSPGWGRKKRKQKDTRKKTESKLKEYKGKEHIGIGRELKKRMKTRTKVRKTCKKIRIGER
jgi:hypothetical protein